MNNFDEACRILDLKQAKLCEAELGVQRLDLYTDNILSRRVRIR